MCATKTFFKKPEFARAYTAERRGEVKKKSHSPMQQPNCSAQTHHLQPNANNIERACHAPTRRLCSSEPSRPTHTPQAPLKPRSGSGCGAGQDTSHTQAPRERHTDHTHTPLKPHSSPTKAHPMPHPCKTHASPRPIHAPSHARPTASTAQVSETTFRTIIPCLNRAVPTHEKQVS